MLDVGTNARDEPTAAHTGKDRIDLLAGMLAQQLHADRSLTGDDVRVIERMNEREPAFRRERQRVLVRLVVVVPVEHDFTAESRHGAYFDIRRGLRHDDDGWNLPTLRRQGDTL